jgi:hypothetical protein
MRRHLIAAAALTLIMNATAASASVISGTWSFEVDAWAVPFPGIPSPPVTGSATFSFDNGASSDDILLPAHVFTSNFGSPLATYSYSQTSDSLQLNFSGSIEIKTQFIDVSTHFVEPSVPPILQHVLFIPSLDVQIAASDFSGGFAPPPVPEPSTWVMLLWAWPDSARSQASNKIGVRGGLPGSLKRLTGPRLRSRYRDEGNPHGRVGHWRSCRRRRSPRSRCCLSFAGPGDSRRRDTGTCRCRPDPPDCVRLLWDAP